ncbi:cation:proton antiporter [Fructobacillus sp. M1-13]|uniref:Cation:proton antiporter n=1 Tax=Fructobacillus papyriferae TaxID=2713171 RepID=A0ABS5QR10_9LACO|nr:cation:proton antiporter [Fructobacillus papyriferae]MBS9334769.1 cation:proton antiporter [Fructobacillus papyriferae]MCD2158759.1 cation:proton antiporter [Fructobacillus papyriferae]
MTAMTLAAMLLLALFLSWLAERLGLPAVVGQIGAGLILGPAGFSVLTASHSLNSWAEIGVVLLMFLAGIESDLDLLKAHLKKSLSVALAGVVTPFVVFYVFGHLLGYGNEQALLWSVLFSATSVSITAQILTEYQQLTSEAGTTILGAAVIDDLLAVFMWTVFQSAFGIGESKSLGLGLSLLLMVGYLVGLLLLLGWLLKMALPVLARLPQPGLLLTVVFALLLSTAHGADVVGLSGAIVAFLLGLLFTRLPGRKGIEHGMTLVGNVVFIPIFFVNIGLKVSWDHQQEHLFLIAILTVLAILTKWLGPVVGARMAGMDKKDAHIVGVGMVSRGEMALVIADLALASGLLKSDIYAAMVLVILLTTIFTPIVLKPMLKMND